MLMNWGAIELYTPPYVSVTLFVIAAKSVENETETEFNVDYGQRSKIQDKIIL